ncbi:hypothetical protein SLEP1_g8546 [Rubroshorea leprosula]|uniref:Protein TONSOKU n=1 Tax=Rubroshorea leprosula TaxID=152421 RepID=A0AAV5I7Z3_9ROSI|nr:hypothetical protein SLEP1_g8546 [Rubroshorea leprosula]
MVRGDEVQITAAKRGFRKAQEEGNRQEEARWANVIGDIHKNRGEYVEALKWFRVDYDISNKYLPEKQLLPTCQSLGEVYLRLEDFKNALIYQKKHLELAKDSDDLVEQQRASTQLGRTYHTMFTKSEEDHYSIHNARKYFRSAMKLAQTLKEKPPDNQSSFLKEYIDAHNNLGMLEMDLDNLELAEKYLLKGLNICDEEEVGEDDDGRTRLHNNLGSVYMELRRWNEAREHIEKDILICKRIDHCVGEAKGYINLGELHYRVQRYDEAILCYQKALHLAKSMEDEDALVAQIEQNIMTVKEAIKVMEEMKKEEQNLKKLSRNTVTAKDKSERRYLLQQESCLDRLIEKSAMISAWLKHCEFAKKKKRMAKRLCDKEKLSDAFLAVGESYQKLRKFNKAIKWYKKSLEGYKSIGNLEGQAMTKINLGNVLDSAGDWAAAFDAFEQGYRIAVEAELPSLELSALENMHYSQMIRFDNFEEARNLQLKIDRLKESNSAKLEAKEVAMDCCSETDTEGDDYLSYPNALSGKRSNSNSNISESLAAPQDLNAGDVPLISLLSPKGSTKTKTANVEECNISRKSNVLPKCSSRSTSNQQIVTSRKRGRLVLSDDEADSHDEDESLRGRLCMQLVEDGTSNEYKNKPSPVTPTCNFQAASPVSKSPIRSCNPVNVEESSCSFKSISPRIATSNAKASRSSNIDEVIIASCSGSSGLKCDVALSASLLHKHDAVNLKFHSSHSENDFCVTFKIDDCLIHVDVGSHMVGDKLSIEPLKIELACLYYLQLPMEKRSKGLLPIIQLMKCGGRTLESWESFDTLKDHLGKVLIDVTVGGWVQKRLMKLYIDCCKELSEMPNMKLLKNLYVSEIEDEVTASECDLQDISITPLLNALHIHKAVAMLDLSHNLLGNGTMEKLQQFFTSSGQKYGDLTLDLHCNRFGPTALFQICECPVLFTRLEVLDISGNRLTDGCGSYLLTILENCKALYSLNVEHCSITSRTIQKVADTLDTGSVLSQLFIGYNNPISGKVIGNLLDKLATLKSFSELSLSGLKSSKPVIDGLCQLAKTSSLSRLMLRGTGIGNEGALQLSESLSTATQESMKLDMSYCGITSSYIHKLSADVTLLSSIMELNLGGNPIIQEGSNALASLLVNPQCCVKALILDKCQLGMVGILKILQALAENESLEELSLASNADADKLFRVQNAKTAEESSESLQPNADIPESTMKTSVSKEVNHEQPGLCAINTENNDIEVADSEDEKAAASGFNDSCTSSCQRNSSLESQFIQELSIAVEMAKHLQVLDLSNNGFSLQASGTLYSAWSSGLRVGLASRHIEDQIIHFSVEGNKCCRAKCHCKRD